MVRDYLNFGKRLGDKTGSFLYKGISDAHNFYKGSVPIEKAVATFLVFGMLGLACGSNFIEQPLNPTNKNPWTSLEDSFD